MMLAMRHWGCAIRGLAGGAALAGIPLQTLQGQGEARDGLLLLRGSDTVVVERFERSSTRVVGEMVIRPLNARFAYLLTLDANGTVTGITHEYRQATSDRASAPLQRGEFSIRGDSAIGEVTSAAGVSQQRIGTRAGVFPFLNPSFVLMEPLIAQALRAGRDSVAIPILNLQGGRTVDAIITRRGEDSVVLNVLGVATRLAVGKDGEILGGLVPVQGLRIVRIRGAAQQLTDVSKPDYSAPSGAPYVAEDVVVRTKEGHTLAGTLTLPKGGAGRVPAFVTITGSGLQDRDETITLVKGYRPYRQIADSLARVGIAVLRMDDRGTGTSGGDGQTATSEHFANDIRAGLDYLRSRPEIDPARLGLIGHSEGGLIAPMIAAGDSTLRGIVLMAGPSQRGKEIIAYQQQFAIENAPALSRTQRDSAMRASQRVVDSLAASSPWFRFFLDYDPRSAARRVKVPVLILQGETDRQVTAAQAHELAATIRSGGNTDVTVHIFPKANHLFLDDADGNPANYGKLPTGAIRTDVMQALVEWAMRVMLQRSP